jgi:hypothetical protein
MSDVYLRAGLSVAKALAVQARHSSESKADIVALRSAIDTITAEMSSLTAIESLANTVRRNGEKIRKKIIAIKQRVRENLKKLDGYLVAVTENGQNGVE